MTSLELSLNRNELIVRFVPVLLETVALIGGDIGG